MMDENSPVLRLPVVGAVTRPDPSLLSFAARAVLERLRALTRELPGIAHGKDPSCVHRARVASRRVRTALRDFAFLMPVKDLTRALKAIRRMRRLLGPLRDADVQIASLEETAASLPDAAVGAGV